MPMLKIFHQQAIRVPRDFARCAAHFMWKIPYRESFNFPKGVIKWFTIEMFAYEKKCCQWWCCCSSMTCDREIRWHSPNGCLAHQKRCQTTRTKVFRSRTQPSNQMNFQFVCLPLGALRRTIYLHFICAARVVSRGSIVIYMKPARRVDFM